MIKNKKGICDPQNDAGICWLLGGLFYQIYVSRPSKYLEKWSNSHLFLWLLGGSKWSWARKGDSPNNTQAHQGPTDQQPPTTTNNKGLVESFIESRGHRPGGLLFFWITNLSQFGEIYKENPFFPYVQSIFLGFPQWIPPWQKTPQC